MSTEVSAIKKKTLRWKKKRHGPKVTTIIFAYYAVRFFAPLIHFFRQHSRLKRRMITIMVMITDENNFFLGL